MLNGSADRPKVGDVVRLFPRHGEPAFIGTLACVGLDGTCVVYTIGPLSCLAWDFFIECTGERPNAKKWWLTFDRNARAPENHKVCGLRDLVVLIPYKAPGIIN